MSLEHRVDKLEERHLMNARRVIVVYGPDGEPHGEHNAKLLREGKAAEAAGETIEWVNIRTHIDRPCYDGDSP